MTKQVDGSSLNILDFLTIQTQHSLQSIHSEQQFFPELQTEYPLSKVLRTRIIVDFFVFPDFGVFPQILWIKYP